VLMLRRTDTMVGNLAEVEVFANLPQKITDLSPKHFLPKYLTYR